jgi:hypothetical protein
MSVRKTKQKHHKWDLDEFLDSARDHIGRFLNNLNARDLIYLLSYLAAVSLIYESITKVSLDIQTIFGMRKNIRGTGGETAIGEIAKQIDQHALLLSMVGAYGLLKLDLGDVTSAVSKVSTAIASVAI